MKWIRDIRRKTPRQHSAEENIRRVHEGLRGEDDVAAPCRHEENAQSLWYSGSEACLEAGKKRPARDTARQATIPAVKGLRAGVCGVKEASVEQRMEDRRLKKRRRTH